MQSNCSWCIETIEEPAEVELGCKTNIYQEETTWDSCGGKRWENLDFGLVSGP